MNKSVAVNIIFNTKTGQLVSATGELNKLSNATDKASVAAGKSSGSFGGLGASIGRLVGVGAVIGVLYKLTDALKSQISSAIALEAQTEQLKASITSLVYVSSQNFSSTGQMLDAQEKWNLSLQTSQKLTDDLSQSAAKLGVGIDEMAAVYKSFAATGMSNLSFEETTKAVELLTIAAKTGGTEMNELVRVIDSVGSGMLPLTGTYGKFLQAQGLTNEAMKEAVAQGKFYELLLEKLGPLQETTAFTANTYTASVARLNSAWSNLKSEAVQRYFDSIKQSINDITQKLVESKDKILAFIDELVNLGQFVWEYAIKPLAELANTIYESVIGALQGLANAFGSTNEEISLFGVLIDGVKIVAVSLGAVFDTITYTIKDFINVLLQLATNIEYAFRKIGDVISGGTQSAQLGKLSQQIKELETQRLDIYNDYNAQMLKVEQVFADIFTTNKENIAAYKSEVYSFANLVDEKLVQKSAPKSPELDALKKSTKAQIDTLKSWWETEFALREKNIELMRAGKAKELEAEKLRFDKVISNLNFEIQKKLQSGEITEQQALALYAVEERLHEQKMKNIAEYSEAYERLRQNINNALEENIGNALNGKFENFGDIFTDMFSSVQESITKGFATSLAQAFMDTQVMEAFNKTLSGAIEGLTGGGAEGGIFGSLGSLFGGGEAGATGGLAQGLGSALGGFALGAGAGSLVAGILGDSSNKKKASNYALGGAAGGAAIGTAIAGPVGALVGSLIGGIGGALVGTFKSSVTKLTGQGVQLWSTATKDSISASEYADYKKTKKSWWGLKSSTSSWTDYYSADIQNLKAIKTALRGYEYLLEDIGGGVKEIAVSAGRYANYASVANAGAKEMIAAFLDIPTTISQTYMTLARGRGGFFSFKLVEAVREVENPDLSAVYNVWASYAKSVNKEVSEALSESLQKYVDTGNSFEAWKLEFEGKSTEALKFQANLAQQQVDRLLDTLGASDINIDNYLAYREQALKESFDPQTIEYINALGEYLMSAADATKKYEDALKDETKTKLNLIDPFLSKARKVDEIRADSADTSEKLLVSILSTLKQTLRLNQESQEAQSQLALARVAVQAR